MELTTKEIVDRIEDVKLMLFALTSHVFIHGNPDCCKKDLLPYLQKAEEGLNLTKTIFETLDMFEYNDWRIRWKDGFELPNGEEDCDERY